MGGQKLDFIGKMGPSIRSYLEDMKLEIIVRSNDMTSNTLLSQGRIKEEWLFNIRPTEKSS